MSVLKPLWLALALASLGGVAQMQAQIVNNGSFELLTVAEPTSGEYTTPFGAFPTTGFSSWTLLASASPSYDGIIQSGSSPFSNSGVTPTNPVAQSGVNAVFLQGTGAASQTITLSTGQYTISYYELGSLSGSTKGPVNCSISGASGNLFTSTNTPTNTGYSAASWQQITGNFTVATAGAYTLTFAGTIPYSTADHTEFIDNVVIVPEPSTTALLGAGMLLFGLAVVRYRRSCRLA